ncbi:propionyl-CoA carboxylase alpha chain, mitochondrial-like isoform X2 [Anthonomus grandis grandis]|uniref:propionyl-CoA carboxylase alpha chain, mitochondrial-like isoform X2 n=1 Tax=Anthonomus grandis grandis TaxID=2921223 RepID=UPI002165CA53|nr:propionyl-CoA carboxylase alpha chain, mitochondrial-like isoform X2 [Anthonomus grandis grandis]
MVLQKNGIFRTLLCICYESVQRSLSLLSQSEEPIFKKVLVANRGEIACRIIRSAKQMGIKTVAVYSVADSQAKHVKMADESVFIGPSPATDSYLNTEKILKAIDETNSDFLHPGYGFLSENSKFVQTLENHNITYIGPHSTMISKMGDKLESKRTAIQAGVNVIPGYDGVIKHVEECVKIAREIGYPVMIKASAGGGGKGMRVARNDQEVKEGFILSTQEARSSFGDTRMLVEKFIENPRHIEIQILGDKFGNIVYLNERECSIQRRNQKVIEEAPSVFLDSETRKAMGQQAVSLCQKLKYYSVGTVEFLIDKNKNFYFLEMNTRLQVEHPITECITGIDLIKEMFKVAKGQKLTINQDDITIDGWAIESRVYAEDPYKQFGLPSIGRLYKYKEPLHIPGVRCDSGVEEGSEISMHYDPLVCKLVTHGKTREEAIKISKRALDSYVIRGIKHNIPLLRDILSNKKFSAGEITTNYLPETYPEGFKGMTLSSCDRLKLLAFAAAIYCTADLRNRIYTNLTPFKLHKNLLKSWQLHIQLDKADFTVSIEETNGQFKVECGEKALLVDKGDIKMAAPLMEVNMDGEISLFQLAWKSASGEYHIVYHGNNYKVKILTKKAATYLDLMPKKQEIKKLNEVKAPMSGLVKSVLCSVGDMVNESQELLVIEAMKMQNFMLAKSNGVVKTLKVKVGDTVTSGDVLINLE